MFVQAERHDTYTRVSMFIDWIEKTILQSGGMDACGYILENNFTDENDAGFQNGERPLNLNLHNLFIFRFFVEHGSAYGRIIRVRASFVDATPQH